MTASRPVALGVAFTAAAVAAVLLYAVARAAQAALLPDADPAAVFYSEHSGYYWRAWTVTYAGGMLGFLAYIAARRDALRTARVLAAGVVVAAIAILLQGALVP
jgi:hypothetical protein